MKRTLIIGVVIGGLGGFAAAIALLFLTKTLSSVPAVSADIREPGLLSATAIKRDLRELQQSRDIDRNRIAALLEIQTALVKRLETSEMALVKMDDAQQALATLCDDSRLRVEMLSKDFQRVPESGGASTVAERNSANLPTASNDNLLFGHHD